jgi:hypothetical protein
VHSWNGAPPAGEDEFERWLAGMDPDGLVSVSYVPWWYGRYSEGWDARYQEQDQEQDRYGAARWSGEAVDDQVPTSRSLTLDGGLVWASCDGDRLRDWSATPQDGWSLRAAKQRGYLQVRFRSGDATVEVQVGCISSRPAFRYRERADGSSDAQWRTSVI